MNTTSPKKKVTSDLAGETEKTATEVINDKDGFVERFEDLYNSSQYSDVTLCVNGDRYFAHKFILITASEVFNAMLHKKWLESNQKEIHLTEEETCIEVFGQFLRYLYCGSVELSINTTLPILLLADKYSIKILQKSCVAYMQRHIVATPDTCRTLSWYQYAKMTGQEELLQECRKFILSNFCVIFEANDWTSLTKPEMIEFLSSSDMIIESEFMLWLHVEEWLLASQNKDKLADNLKDILPLIHFSMILPKHLLLIESSSICKDFDDLFGAKMNFAYRHHSLAIDCNDMGISSEPYRNYTDEDYKVCYSFSLKDYNNAQRIESKISLKCRVPSKFMSPNHQNCEKQSFPLQFSFYPKGFFSIITLYGSYVGRRNDYTTLKLVRRCVNELPVKVHVTLVLYSVLNSVTYVSFTHNSHHFLTRENNFEDTVENVIDIKKLSESSQYLVDGDLEGKLFVKIEDVGDNLIEREIEKW